MERDKNDIEDLFKDSFDNYEPDVKPKVWNNVKKVLKWGSAGLLIKFLVNKIGTNTIVAFVSSAITVVSTVLIMEKIQSAEKTQPSTEKAETTLPTVEMSSAVTISGDSSKSELSKESRTINEKSDVFNFDEQKIEKSFKNTSLVEVNTVDPQKIKSVIKDFSEQSIAIISASPVSGSSPLVVNLMNIGTGTDNKWTFSDGQTPSKEPNPPCVFIEAGTHTVILQSKAADGKIAFDSVHITVTGNSFLSSPPNVFSPNDDDVADVFTFQSKNISEMEAEIYDKKGKLVYRWVGNDGKWDGKTFKGEKVPEGIYYYIVSAEGVDGKRYEQKGKIKLTR
jgi:gliding motility-associated-like protein